MQIDVIIPTFNRAYTIANSIQSVLNQTYPHFRIYIVDDGSKDNTQEILETYKKDSRVSVLRQENKGVSAARNFGIKNSHSPWIAFLDSDDEWMPNKLEIQVNYLNQNPAFRFIHTEEIWIRNGVRVNPKIKYQKKAENLFLRSLDFCLISPSTVLLKRELLIEQNYFDEAMIVCEDYDLWLKILFHEKNIGFISTPLTKKNGGHPDQLSTKYVAMDYWRLKSLVNLYNSISSTNERNEIKNVILKKCIVLQKGYLKHGHVNLFIETKNIYDLFMSRS